MVLLYNFATIITGIFALFIFCYLLFTSVITQKCWSKKIKAPEAGNARPFLGHLHLLGRPKPAHITLRDMADKYGPIFTIRLGMRRALVISDWELAKECFTTNDKAFANRPETLAAEILGYNYAMFGFSPYGNYWRHVRKTVIFELLSNQRLEKLRHVRESEMRASIVELYKLGVKGWSSNGEQVVVEMKRWFQTMYLNLIFTMVLGKRYSEVETSVGDDDQNNQRRKALRDFFEFVGTFAISDSLPYLRWLDLGGLEKAMKKTAKELDQILEEQLEEHKRLRNSRNVVDGPNDFMDTMYLSFREDNGGDLSSYDADTINKATCMAIILASIDATTVTAVWALALLLNHPNALKKALEELDSHVGRERNVQESDIKNLVYLQAIIKETMRLYPAVPLSIPRESVEECTVGGYSIPSGTRLIINLVKLQRDPNVWSNADEFQPERFLTTHKHVDVKGKNYELLPFGSGRRVCPGSSLAVQLIQLVLASLLHAFDVTTPSNESIDMTEAPTGVSNLKATPLQVLLTPRLPTHLYQ